MSKIKYDILLPKSNEQFESLFQSLFKTKNSKHTIILLLENYINLEGLIRVLKKYEKQILKFRRNQSIVLLSAAFGYDAIPDFIPIAPTEEEALDIIDFENIERELSFPEK